MLITPHFLTGVAVASKIPSFWPAAIIVLVLHFILDAIPHRDTIGGTHLNLPNLILVLGDVIIAFLILFLIIKPEYIIYSLAIGLMAVLPDIIEVPGLLWPRYNKLPIIKQFHHWHTYMLQYSKGVVNWFWGLLPQFLIVVIVLYILLK